MASGTHSWYRTSLNLETSRLNRKCLYRNWELDHKVLWGRRERGGEGKGEGHGEWGRGRGEEERRKGGGEVGEGERERERHPG